MNLRRCLATIVVLAFLPALPGTTAAQDASQLYREGVAARHDQQFVDAADLLERAANLQPENADIFVQLGFSYLGLDRRDAAASAFARALDLAPDYADAHYGLALIAYRDGDLDRAESNVRTVLSAQPENEGATRLLGDIEAARSAGMNVAAADLPWRLDVSGELSALTGGRGDWIDSRINLAKRIDRRTTIGGSLRLAERYGFTDTQPGLRVDHRLDERLGVYGEISGTPDADFLADVSLGAGAVWQAVSAEHGIPPVLLSIDLDQDFYADTEITTVFPGIRIGAYEDRFVVGARGVVSLDDTGADAYGYVLRLDLRPHPHVGLLAGYGNAPEISEGKLIDTETIFTGASFDISDRLTLRASYAHEMRNAFDRDIFSLAFSHRF